MWEAYQKVRANKGAPGVDEVTLAEFESDLENNLYRIWNRMSSGSYFPPPVKGVSIPKPQGKGTRVLGVPTIRDRVAQTVAALALQPRTEQIFHPDSYGYRAGRSAVDAVEVCRQRCWRSNWVIDLDIQDFFGSARHDLILKAVEANIGPGQGWVLLYVRRWLTAPIQHRNGTVETPTRGTPQGSSVSPALANLLLHYALDLWLSREYPQVGFERYVDDAVVHCATRRQALEVRAAVAARLAEVGLTLHPTKTKVVYCKDAKRQGSWEHTSFTFLGYTFRPRASKNRKTGQLFTSFAPAMSRDAQKAASRRIRAMRIHMRTRTTLDGLADAINPIVRGWINFYGRFNRHEMYPLLMRINAYIMRWARRKYKRLRSYKRLRRWWNGLVKRAPDLFSHWALTTTPWGRIR